MSVSVLWMVSALAMVGYAVVLTGSRWSGMAMGAAFAFHLVALVVDVVGDGTHARFGFATALSATVWLVVGAHGLERAAMAFDAPRRALAAAGLGVVLLAAVFPGVHRSSESAWAPLHWTLGIVSYGLMGAAVLHAWLLDRAEKRLRHKATGGVTSGLGVARGPNSSVPTPTLPLLTLERLTFRFVDAGFVVLTVALILGVWFATHGASPWRWTNHKTVLSVAGWLVFAALVVGRHARGWRGRRATRWVYVGAALLLLAYVGSQFVSSVLLGRG